MSITQIININKIRTKKEKIYFKISLVFSAIFWIYILSPFQVFFSSNKIQAFASVGWTISILALFQLFFTFINLLSMAYIRTNALKLSEKQLPLLYKTTKEISVHLGLKKTPDIFIINSGGLLNAFATKMLLRRIVVLYSDLVDALTIDNDKKQITAVLAHELGHHALGHTEFWINYFISPSSILIPLSAALSRAREYSADRVMKSLLKDQNICSQSLIKLATGGKLAQKVDIKAYTDQIKEEGGFFSWFAEILSSHPFLPKRILAIQKIAT